MARERIAKNTINTMTNNDLYERGFNDGMRKAVEITFYMTADAINYKLGFGRKRLQRIMYSIYNNIDSFRTGHLEPNDFETIKNGVEKLGVKLK